MSSSTPLASPDAAPAPSAAARALAFYWGNYLPLMMVFVVFFGYLIPAPGESPTHLPAAGARLTRARAGAGKALDKPKIELCSEGDADCEMGTIKVPPPSTPTPPRPHPTRAVPRSPPRSPQRTIRTRGLPNRPARCCWAQPFQPRRLIPALPASQVTSSLCVICIFILSGAGQPPARRSPPLKRGRAGGRARAQDG